VALVQSDNLWQLEKNLNRGDAGDPFPGPGTANKIFFNAASSPASNFYSGATSDVNVANISASASVMTARLIVNQPPIECLFNWAEVNYPTLFSPSGSSTATWDVYTYRYYSVTNTYLGVSSADSHVYYMGSDGNKQDVGPQLYWLSKAGCQ
jgi:hypothetical protein